MSKIKATPTREMGWDWDLVIDSINPNKIFRAIGLLLIEEVRDE